MQLRIRTDGAPKHMQRHWKMYILKFISYGGIELQCIPGLMATTRMLPIMVGIVLVIMMYKKHTALTFPFDLGSMEAVPVIF